MPCQPLELWQRQRASRGKSIRSGPKRYGRQGPRASGRSRSYLQLQKATQSTLWKTVWWNSFHLFFPLWVLLVLFERPTGAHPQQSHPHRFLDTHVVQVFQRVTNHVGSRSLARRKDRKQGRPCDSVSPSAQSHFSVENQRLPLGRGSCGLSACSGIDGHPPKTRQVRQMAMAEGQGSNLLMKESMPTAGTNVSKRCRRTGQKHRRVKDNQSPLMGFDGVAEARLNSQIGRHIFAAPRSKL